MQDIEQLYQEYAQLVYKYLVSLCHDRDWAEDMTQETFLRAVAKLDSYQNDGNSRITTWFCQIAKHVWYQELEKKKKKGQIGKLSDRMIADSQNEPEILLQCKETRIELFRTVQALKEPDRSVVHLRMSGELTFGEIGEILGRSENWARVTYYRSREKLARYMREEQKPF